MWSIECLKRISANYMESDCENGLSYLSKADYLTIAPNIPAARIIKAGCVLVKRNNANEAAITAIYLSSKT